jgi:hypothetical protein
VHSLALIFASRPVLIKSHDYTLYAKVFNIIFHKKWQSMEFASPAVLGYIHEQLVEAQADLGKKAAD